MSYNAFATPTESNTRSSDNLFNESNANKEQTTGYNNEMNNDMNNDNNFDKVQENIKMKQKLYQYEYIIKTQQEQLREYHDLLHKYEVQSLNCELLQLRLQHHLLTTNNNLNQSNEPEPNRNHLVPVDNTNEHTNNHDHGHNEANEASLSASESESDSASASEESRRNADLVNEVMRLTLELAQSRSQSDSQLLQIREITAERDALQDEVNSTREDKNETRKIMRGRALLKRIGQTSSRIFRFDDEL